MIYYENRCVCHSACACVFVRARINKCIFHLQYFVCGRTTMNKCIFHLQYFGCVCYVLCKKLRQQFHGHALSLSLPPRPLALSPLPSLTPPPSQSLPPPLSVPTSPSSPLSLAVSFSLSLSLPAPILVSLSISLANLSLLGTSACIRVY